MGGFFQRGLAAIGGHYQRAVGVELQMGTQAGRRPFSSMPSQPHCLLLESQMVTDGFFHFIKCDSDNNGCGGEFFLIPLVYSRATHRLKGLIFVCSSRYAE